MVANRPATLTWKNSSKSLGSLRHGKGVERSSAAGGMESCVRCSAHTMRATASMRMGRHASQVHSNKTCRMRRIGHEHESLRAQLDVRRVDVLRQCGDASVGNQHVDAVRMRSAHLSGGGLRAAQVWRRLRSNSVGSSR